MTTGPGTGRVRPWSEVKITNGTETVLLTVTGSSEKAFYGIPRGADRERPRYGPDTRDHRTTFERPQWRIA